MKLRLSFVLGSSFMKKILSILFLGLALTLLQSCSSTGVKDISQLNVPSSTEANIYLKRTGGFVLGGTRAIIKIDGNEYGSLYPKDFLKINVQPGNRTLTIAGDLKQLKSGELKSQVLMQQHVQENYYQN